MSGTINKRSRTLRIKKRVGDLNESEENELEEAERKINDYLKITIPMPVTYGRYYVQKADRLLEKYRKLRNPSS